MSGVEKILNNDARYFLYKIKGMDEAAQKTEIFKGCNKQRKTTRP